MTGFVVGLTGGIGSGKTTVARMFAARGADVVDTDEIAHELTAPGGAAIESVKAEFGARAIAPDGSMDRAAMRALVFEDPGARERLEAVLHPMIRAESARRLAASAAPYALLVVPLLLEHGRGRSRVDRVLVVDCPETLQIERVIRRSGLAEAQVRAIMSAQLTRAERNAGADDLVTNDGGTAELEARVAALDERYRDLAAAKR